ncbi:MAG: hypothetical protein V2A54_08565 [Bacteroidota bacterium]
MKCTLLIALLITSFISFGQMKKSVNYEKNAVYYFEDNILYKDLLLRRMEVLMPLRLIGIMPGYLIRKYCIQKKAGLIYDSILPTDRRGPFSAMMIKALLGVDSVILSKSWQAGIKPDKSWTKKNSVIYNFFYCRREFMGSVYVAIVSRFIPHEYAFVFVFELNYNGQVKDWCRLTEYP